MTEHARLVRLATTDEMCVGFITVVKANQDLTLPAETDDLQEILRQSYLQAGRPQSGFAVGE
jgi:hypothetical protein